MTHRAKDRSGLVIRLVLVLISILGGVLVAELAVRVQGIGQDSTPVIVTSEGQKVPLGELVHYLRHSGEVDRFTWAGPRARMQANLVFRVVYDAPGWSLFNRKEELEYRTNALGFRDEPFPIEKPDGELRIMALGDSFTYGMGARLETTWAQVLEQRLRQERSSPVEVINAGFAAGSHYPPGYLDWLRSDGMAFEPDILILGFCLNDMSIDIPMLSYARVDPQPWLGGRSRLLNHFQRNVAQRKAASVSADFTDTVTRDDSTWRQTQAALVEMRDFLAERGCRFVVAVFPMLSQLGENYPYLGLHTMVNEVCAANAIEYVDLLPQVRGLDERTLWADRKDQHPNRLGHRLLAEGIFEYLRKRGL
jgi:lysophospholipase L1-like esterase